MKKRHYLYMAISIVILLIGYACVKEYEDLESQPDSKNKYSNGALTVQEAREFFEGFVTEFKVAGFSQAEEQATRSGRSMPPIAPVWSKGKSFTFEGVPTVETPLNIPPVSVQIKKDGQEVTYFKNTIYYLLAGKTGEGEILYYVVTYTADVQWMLKHNLNKLRKLSLSDMSNFSGAIRFYDLSGNLLGGKFLKEGVCSGIIKASANSVFNYGGSNNMTRSGWNGTCAFPDIEYTFTYVCDWTCYDDPGDEFDYPCEEDGCHDEMTEEYVCNDIIDDPSYQEPPDGNIPIVYVTVIVNPPLTGTISGLKSGVYRFNDHYIIQATPISGYHFDYWTLLYMGETEIFYGYLHDLYIGAYNMTLTANFAPN